MDTTTLDSIEELLKLHPNGTHAVIAEGPSGQTLKSWALTGEILLELTSLARKELERERLMATGTAVMMRAREEEAVQKAERYQKLGKWADRYAIKALQLSTLPSGTTCTQREYLIDKMATEALDALQKAES